MGQRLKQEQARFASENPLYQQIIIEIKNLVKNTPGILQTDIYKKLSFTKEDISYVLYFGALLNDIRREKKGRTYAVFPAGETIDIS
ncbi:MAG: hypothetical protein GOV02_01295 [Candidatus Aenigmarchaeota archaeon]|nr:hypothetical protein [Candidatus Aenigmarchaeota archaeon]